ncbi:hypothetical protein [Aurantiacibacter rhizosphaerae]|uniref:Uncharacterized protein n=1 Tax=Aurantiacibacter rhizosphaerae TaxID=2691582 RepID=A0A844XC69_9SPHN|nr:hypothetical protein [Aurantiacibacter rhizosphaerae]MWV28101.1 hypothetical protein [Aurantiacibacter rhizosphaerae]
MLTPVAIDDPLLRREDTFVSAAARVVMADAKSAPIHCLDLPENHPDGARTCLTQGEWQAVFDRIAQQESADLRDRQIARSQWNATPYR